MLYPENLETKLGFDKIRQLLKEECVSSLGRGFVDKMQFSNHFDLIDKFAKQTAEFCEILRQNEDFPRHNYLDVSPQLAKAVLENAFLTESEFFDLMLSLKTIYQCLQFFKKRALEVYPQLRELSAAIAIDPDLIDKIEFVIDDRGKVRDNASFELRRIRTALLNQQAHLRKRIEQILKSCIQQGYTKEDSNITIRDGRMVIPLSAEFKRRVKGLVHDESATGQTVFLEPAEIFDLNNEIRELEYQEKREIIRILTELTDAVRPYIPDLRQAYQFLGIMDFIRAKARFALKIGAVNPAFEKTTTLKWREARHPLLYLSHLAQQKPVVPLNIDLSENQRLLLISGPNAGGKSVTLKTVGLLQYMYQSGLLIPVREDSVVGLFRDMFIDIGDEQSIENDLSTYSSHLTSMRQFLKFADNRTLILIDEFGTGTEPAMGGAIAEAILLKLNQAKVFGVITTHYTNLKFVAENTQGLVNGAMLYDGENLEPLYKLEIGRPGSSFAFEIATKIGLPKEVIHHARQKVGSKQVNLDTLLRELDTEKRNFAEKNLTLAQQETDLKTLTAQYNRLKEQLDNDRKKLLNQAKEEAQKLLQNANQRIEQTIRVIKEQKAEKEVTKEIRKEFEAFVLEMQPEKTEVQPEEEIEIIEGEIKIGDHVRIKDSATLGKVTALKGKDVEIVIGELKSNIKLNRLEKISRKEAREQKKEMTQAMQGLDVSEKMANFSFKLDLRGKRGEEALVELADFMDDALLLGQNDLQIIHGKGDGILRKLIREALKKYTQVRKMEDEHADRGGAGVTLVYLKG
jgi:DNA mismatch repair protein MutS2